MLRWGIPAYRCRVNILTREINEILATGVVLRRVCQIGRDIAFNDLTSNIDAIYLGVGAQASPALGIENDQAQGVIGAVEFLRDINLGKQVAIGKRVAVIGGGNSAVDAARTARRLGAEVVSLIYRRDRKDMPAQEAEIIAAEQEGIVIHLFVTPVKVLTTDNQTIGLELIRLKPGLFDRSGRRRPETIPDSEFQMEVDTVISALGQATDLSFLTRDVGVTVEKGLIQVDGGLQTDHPRVWAGGDVVTGPAMVIDAIAAGARAARQIDGTLRAAKGEKPSEPVQEKIDIPFEVDEALVETPQPTMPEVPAAKRRWGFMEVELGYTLDTAMAEARRCLRCDVKTAP